MLRSIEALCSASMVVAALVTTNTFAQQTQAVNPLKGAWRITETIEASGSSVAQNNNRAGSDVRPDVVVQRFVDAAVARDAVAMAALVAPDAIFARFPSGEIIVQSRERIQEHYSRQLQSLPPDFRIIIKPRIVEGQFVIDQEHFNGVAGNRRQATWMYLVRDGLIQRAWVLESNSIP